eukprot:3113646-Amphidinium_carterae.1
MSVSTTITQSEPYLGGSLVNQSYQSLHLRECGRAGRACATRTRMNKSPLIATSLTQPLNLNGDSKLAQ